MGLELGFYLYCRITIWSIGGLETIDLQSGGNTPLASQTPTPAHTPSSSLDSTGFFSKGREE